MKIAIYQVHPAKFQPTGDMSAMRLLVLINNYIGKNSTNAPSTVERVLEAFAEYSHMEVDIVLFSTREVRAGNIPNIVYPSELSFQFAFMPRQWLMENLCCLEHDYIMYMENDLIVPERSVLNCIAINAYLKQFSGNYISGFIRYERKPQKAYIDMLPSVRPTVLKVLTSNDGRKFWIPGNLHSGNFLLSRQQLNQMIQLKQFQTTHAQYGKQYYGILESAASDIYLDYIKVLPEDFTEVEIEHVTNRYKGLTHKELSLQIAAL